MSVLLDFTKRRKGSRTESGRRIEVYPEVWPERNDNPLSGRENGICVHTAENHGFALGVRDF
jgi:hypothetical protein